MSNECCKKCFYSQKIDEDEDMLVCKRYPPSHFRTHTDPITCHESVTFFQPVVFNDAWCGEYE